jgi:cyclophilin family peptidyl-prolyl cis-trans isomerase
MSNRPLRIAVFAATVAVISLLAACGSDEPDAAVPATDTGQPASTQTPQSTPTSAPIAQQPAIKTYTSPPPMTIDTDKSYTATFQMEKGGEFTIELYAKEAPLTVNSFVFLARDGYYDGITFHRVLEGFMAQSGDPTGTGSGGPGYTFENEPSPLRRHDTVGTVSMANSGIRNGRGTNGSQFFITFLPTTFLDGNEPDGTPKDCSIPGTSCHTVFGRVIEGMDVVNSISLRDPARATTPGDAIKTIVITEGKSTSASTPETKEPAIKTYSSAPAMTIDTDKSYTATFQMAKGGEFTIELYPKEAPVTVNNFVFLARDGYYDGITFHRVLEGFMAQSGDPTGTGSGGPGYNFDNEPSPLRRHDTVGTVSMANAGVRNGLGTNGSQFFITFVPTTFLDGNEPDGTPKDCSVPGTSCHTVFGRVTEGMDVVTKISLRDPARATNPGDAIKTIIITESD